MSAARAEPTSMRPARTAARRLSIGLRPLPALFRRELAQLARTRLERFTLLHIGREAVVALAVRDRQPIDRVERAVGCGFLDPGKRFPGLAIGVGKTEA